MNFNLIQERWISVRRVDGSTDKIAPWEVSGGDPPCVDLSLPRMDFRSAMFEFLIGLVQTIFPPKDATEWKEKLVSPPAPEELLQAMERIKSYFNLFEKKPLFLQDFELSASDSSVNHISGLLIDSPGDNALRLNSDFFVKRGRVEALCPPCAAMGLFTLQAFAPSGGKGNRTSLRGGGPLSTITLGETLWEKIWLNVLPLNEKGVESLPASHTIPGSVFPWAAPTRTSEKKGSEILPQDVHFLHAYWGMPRRILLLPEETSAPETCSICSLQGTTVVKEYIQRPYGYNYGDGWTHPLTPYRYQAGDVPPLAVKGAANITGYVNWLGLVYGNIHEDRGSVKPALCIHRQRKSSPNGSARILASGFDMDNMKPRQWCEGELPFVAVADDYREDFREWVEKLVQAADKVKSNLMFGLKEGLFHEIKRRDVSADQTRLSNASGMFWGYTEASFYELVRTMVPVLEHESEEDLLKLRLRWAHVLEQACEKLFQAEVQSALFHPDHARRIHAAQFRMRNFNGAALRKILELPEKWRSIQR
ncbi:type I-E CRISPR-associated protein Cse1/CasA [Desulfonatronum lacustre]|uniref:type I-E CRISPR-associated protein Cse1/CasA n=1 Tax=Desulfonatronum lacustre TaxID=66849 RepID=UPI0004B8EE44|nr:type I-E CRISPR-associated protein Cse1/CasA [Desulfonatronum lacustre]